MCLNKHRILQSSLVMIRSLDHIKSLKEVREVQSMVTALEFGRIYCTDRSKKKKVRNPLIFSIAWTRNLRFHWIFFSQLCTFSKTMWLLKEIVTLKVYILPTGLTPHHAFLLLLIRNFSFSSLTKSTPFFIKSYIHLPSFTQISIIKRLFCRSCSRQIR